MYSDSVYFHEDNFCQIELLPIQNTFIKRDELGTIKDNTEKTLNNDGFINIVSREQVKYPLINLNIDCNTFRSLLQEYFLFYFEKVYTGYASQKTLKDNIHGFGFENYILYYEINNDIVTRSWIDYNQISDTLNIYPENLQNALFKLGTTYDLILIDWNELITVVLKNNTSLTNYVTEVL